MVFALKKKLPKAKSFSDWDWRGKSDDILQADRRATAVQVAAEIAKDAFLTVNVKRRKANATWFEAEVCAFDLKFRLFFDLARAIDSFVSDNLSEACHGNEASREKCLSLSKWAKELSAEIDEDLAKSLEED